MIGVGAVMVRHQIVGGVDESNVRKCLREVSNHHFRGGIVLFGEEPEVVTTGYEFVEELLRLFTFADQNQVVDVPEAAC